MFSDPYFQSELARQRQADIRSAARAARTTRVFRLARREARRQRRAALAVATPAPVSLPPAAALLQQ
ncbi:hypothetical protein D0Z08_03025 [Nocardioides immobilis]|uniref:Uncharacterized protein n=1 Tax=Nocardioides immobilis TaxID=2049295 RepID=A0A417Y810_9ACTN|nr:hypothetical protein [Nocardioides immobilis]RHW28833.1 hypothetical protein D0Z08_03025 [Nocardioides immobilis]